MPPKSTPFFTRRRVFSSSIRRLEEILSILVVLWTLLSFQNSTNPSEFYMTSKEDSNLSHLRAKRKTSNYAESKRNSLDQTRFVTSSLTTEELLNSYPKRFKSKTPSNWILRPELLTQSIRWKWVTWPIVPRVTTLVESEPFKSSTSLMVITILSPSETLLVTNSLPELLTSWSLEMIASLKSLFLREMESSRTSLRSRRKDLRRKIDNKYKWI